MNIYLYRIFVSETLFQLTDTAVNSSTRVSNKLQQDIVWKHVTMENVATNILPEEMLHWNTILSLSNSHSQWVCTIFQCIFLRVSKLCIHSFNYSFIYPWTKDSRSTTNCLFVSLHNGLYFWLCLSIGVSGRIIHKVKSSFNSRRDVVDLGFSSSFSLSSVFRDSWHCE